MLTSKTLTALFAGAIALPVANGIHGTEHHDLLGGTVGDDRIYGYGGDDTIYPGDGDDVCFGGGGDDWMADITGGDDTMHGGAGDDGFRPGPGDDVMFGGAGDDIMHHALVELFPTGPCNPQLSGYDRSFGGSGDDTLTWASGALHHFVFPLTPCSHGGDGWSNGGGGWDTVFVGLGSFTAYSTDYEVDHVQGSTYRLTSLVSGAVLELQNYEQIIFLDTTMIL